jgi:hypothetical protein
MSFGLCSSWNTNAQIKKWSWSSVFRILFYCENEDEAKILTMRLVVDMDKYQKAEEAKHFWIHTFFF